MVTALKRHVRLLWAYVANAQTDADYFGEIAGKLRLLIVQGKSNRPLLLEVADAYGLAVSVDEPGDPYRSFEAFLDNNMLKVGDRAITFREVICRWAEQSGGAHEDWALDEMLTKTWTHARLGTTPLGHVNLTTAAVKVVFRAKELLAKIDQMDPQ